MLSNHLTLCHPFLFLPSIFPRIGASYNELLFTSGGQRIGASASASVLPVNIKGWSPLGLTGLISWQPKELSRVFFSTKIWKHQFLSGQPTLQSNSNISTWLQGNHSFDRRIFVGKVMPLLFHMLSTFVTACLPMSKHLLISWLQSLFAMILKPKKIKSVTVAPFSLSICNKVMWTDVMILVFWMLSYKPAFSFSSFILIKFFSSFSLSAIREALHVND